MTEKLLIISFDLIRKGESEKSLAIASLLSYLKGNKDYGKRFLVDHLPINMYNIRNCKKFYEIEHYFSSYNFQQYNYIAISAYIWNEYLLNDFIKYLRINKKYSGKIILGGYQITYSNNLEREYKDCQFFISGYAEKSLLSIITNKEKSKYLKSDINLYDIPSPYLTNELPISKNQKAVRFETKRGCPYRCSYCAHRDLIFNRVYKHNMERVFKELYLFKEKNVKKINIIDPIFNIGEEYLEILKEITRLNIKSLISIQARFENIKGEEGKLFIDLCKKININLEFGLQTSNDAESKIINRKNDIKHVKNVMKILNKSAINYEISLIYGLPTQTLNSFKESINFVRENGCNNIVAFPLMLLKGTELYEQKKKYKMKEEKIGDYNIPIVVSSNSFSKKEWLEMKKLAENLNEKKRIT